PPPPLKFTSSANSRRRSPFPSTTYNMLFAQFPSFHGLSFSWRGVYPPRPCFNVSTSRSKLQPTSGAKIPVQAGRLDAQTFGRSDDFLALHYRLQSGETDADTRGCLE